MALNYFYLQLLNMEIGSSFLTTIGTMVTTYWNNSYCTLFMKHCTGSRRHVDLGTDMDLKIRISIQVYLDPCLIYL